MECKVLMRKTILIAALGFTASLANAECYLRSNSIGEAQANIERVADIQFSPVKLANGDTKCTATYSALIKGKWHLAEGTATAKDKDQACQTAQNFGNAKLLEQISGTKLTVNQEVLCTDQDLPRPRTTKKGDIVRISEVNINPAWPKPMLLDGAKCVWFLESKFTGSDLSRPQGIMCQVTDTGWQVIDKF